MDQVSKVSVLRYDPDKDVSPRYEQYEVPFSDGMTVLEVLKYIYDNYSPIVFRYGCRIKVCGSCSVMMNNRPVMACKEKAEKVMTIEPIPVLPTIKDLAVDFDAFFDKRVKIRPFIEPPKKKIELPRQLSYDVVNKYRECETCVECLICDAACPVVAKTPHLFAGPCTMLEIARLYRDPQDSGDRIRLAVSEGLFNCDLCGKCTEMCPVGIKIHRVIDELQQLARKQEPMVNEKASGHRVEINVDKEGLR